MSQQQMMFPPAEGPKPEGEEQRQAQAEGEPRYPAPSFVEAGYEAHEAFGKVQPGSSSLPAWQLALIIVVLVIIGSLFVSYLNNLLGLVLALAALIVLGGVVVLWGFRRVVTLPPSRFEVTGRPTLIIRNPAGPISIHRGGSHANTLEILATKYLSGLWGGRDELTVDCQQRENAVSVTVSSLYQHPFSLANLGYVRLDISVPAVCDLQIEGNAGSVQILGGQGRLTVKTNAGTITVLQATLEDRSSLETDAGTITVQQSRLCGQVYCHTNAGAISFGGALEPGGHYQMTTNAGAIDVSLPSDTSMLLAASSSLGGVTNEFGQTLVGEPPRANLQLHTNLGTVTVRRTGLSMH
ncbi:MAG: hypothetical protein IMW90_15790 [Thermogemmatispora sp.]|jgi:hypothetical protein|uniref:Adhesin domain-containing protein n=1 Tax=Thermogemmatispora aurantia TaxID=2045279 RepID=A0A5J4K387_9CHLR|nr:MULTISPECIES: hypothetical protein [Thermogemmatispora]MBE3567180.1 hypothetical protein [Thermogemmatispora sp.]GER81622.1 hypothetical protein KTAU_02600 [Thermogemmatispora aurantia]